MISEKTIKLSIENAIISEYHSIRAFCYKNQIPYKHLLKTLHTESRLTVSMFIRICNGLKITMSCPEHDMYSLGNFSVTMFYKIPFGTITNNLILLSYE